MKDVVVKLDIPFGVSKDIVKLAQSWVCSPIAPSEMTILKVDLVKLTKLKHFLKTINPAMA